MILLSAIRGLALIGLLALPDADTPVAVAAPVDLNQVLAGGQGHDSVQHASLLTSLGGFVTGVHALQGAVESQIEFRPVEGEDNVWEVYLCLSNGTWIHAGEASMNYAEELHVHGDNGTGFASFVCQPGGRWTWTAFSGSKKIGSGTMS
jgi:hypothetical protein